MTKGKKRAAREFTAVDPTENPSEGAASGDVGETRDELYAAGAFANEIIEVGAQRDLSNMQLLQAALTVVTHLIQKESTEMRH